MRLIDAEVLLKKLEWLEEYDYIVFNNVKRTVDEMPAVDAEPVRHGMYIGTEYDGYADGNPVYYEWKCSECGCVFEEDEPSYNYCPNCGAKMDEMNPED